jgi:magnesium chelatase family protein
VAAMNPCPCGYLDDRRRQCRCSDRMRALYSSRISGPLLDRIDLQVTVHPPTAECLLGEAAEEGSLSTAQAVEAVRRARARQRGRAKELNARLPPRALDRACPLDREARALLMEAARNSIVSARGIVKVKRVARTIADLGDREAVSAEDVSEALGLRQLEGLRGERAAAPSLERLGT